MTRKHFKTLADCLKFERPFTVDGAQAQKQWNKDVQAIAKVCKAVNPGFKFDRFYTACGDLFER